MKRESRKFLAQFEDSTPGSFDNRFYLAYRQLGLETSFGRNELTLLYRAASLAADCNAALNGLDEFGPGIKPEHEPRRHRLEIEFLQACEVFSASPGWQNLSDSEQQPICKAFLQVCIAEENLIL